MPHHTDTFACYYNVDFLKQLGVEPPASLDKSWSWSEFIRIGRTIKDKGLAPYGFAMAWQTAAGYRWLPFLYQHGGQLLDADLRNPEINSPKGIETIAWTQSWFKEGLVPPSTYVKSTEQTQNLFANGTIGLLLGGDWQIPFPDEEHDEMGMGCHLHAARRRHGVRPWRQLPGGDPRQQGAGGGGRLPEVHHQPGEHARIHHLRAVPAGANAR